MNNQKGISGFLILIIVAVILLGGFIFFQVRHVSPRVINTTPTIAPTAKPTPSPSMPPLPEFSKDPIPKTSIDTKNWKLFEDKTVGFSFMYPPEWGEPTLEHPLAQTGQAYSLGFPQSSFGVSGASKDFSIGRDGDFSDFNGFEGTLSFRGGVKSNCNITDFLKCQGDDKKVNLLVGAFCPDGLPGYRSFTRMMFLDRPGKTISGLVFAGNVTKYSNDELPKWFCNPNFTPNKTNIDAFNQALLNRKLDAQSLENFDTLEAALSTVKTF